MKQDINDILRTEGDAGVLARLAEAKPYNGKATPASVRAVGTDCHATPPLGAAPLAWRDGPALRPQSPPERWASATPPRMSAPPTASQTVIGSSRKRAPMSTASAGIT